MSGDISGGKGGACARAGGNGTSCSIGGGDADLRHQSRARGTSSAVRAENKPKRADNGGGRDGCRAGGAAGRERCDDDKDADHATRERRRLRRRRREQEQQQQQQQQHPQQQDCQQRRRQRRMRDASAAPVLRPGTDERRDAVSAGPPTEAAVRAYAREVLGVDADGPDAPLLWVAREALRTGLPTHWRAMETESGVTCYHNTRTGQVVWEHPVDEHFRRVCRVEREKLIASERTERRRQNAAAALVQNVSKPTANARATPALPHPHARRLDAPLSLGEIQGGNAPTLLTRGPASEDGELSELVAIRTDASTLEPPQIPQSSSSSTPPPSSSSSAASSCAAAIDTTSPRALAASGISAPPPRPSRLLHQEPGIFLLRARGGSPPGHAPPVTSAAPNRNGPPQATLPGRGVPGTLPGRASEVDEGGWSDDGGSFEDWSSVGDERHGRDSNAARVHSSSSRTATQGRSAAAGLREHHRSQLATLRAALRRRAAAERRRLLRQAAAAARQFEADLTRRAAAARAAAAADLRAEVAAARERLETLRAEHERAAAAAEVEAVTEAEATARQRRAAAAAAAAESNEAEAAERSRYARRLANVRAGLEDELATAAAAAAATRREAAARERAAAEQLRIECERRVGELRDAARSELEALAATLAAATARESVETRAQAAAATAAAREAAQEEMAAAERAAADEVAARLAGLRGEVATRLAGEERAVAKREAEVASRRTKVEVAERELDVAEARLAARRERLREAYREFLGVEPPPKASAASEAGHWDHGGGGCRKPSWGKENQDPMKVATDAAAAASRARGGDGDGGDLEFDAAIRAELSRPITSERLCKLKDEVERQQLHRARRHVGAPASSVHFVFNASPSLGDEQRARIDTTSTDAPLAGKHGALEFTRQLAMVERGIAGLTGAATDAVPSPRRQGAAATMDLHGIQLGVSQLMSSARRAREALLDL
ncbi:hypothetical protein HK405_010045 [Cladochytrium tenue]|nr:hypothetical protein HK405_010045 [Cladochytrium tenue]